MVERSGTCWWTTSPTLGKLSKVVPLQATHGGWGWSVLMEQAYLNAAVAEVQASLDAGQRRAARLARPGPDTRHPGLVPDPDLAYLHGDQYSSLFGYSVGGGHDLARTAGLTWRLVIRTHPGPRAPPGAPRPTGIAQVQGSGSRVPVS